MAKELREYKKQTVTLTLAAALEAVCRVLIDEHNLANCELSRKIVKALGFKV